VSPKPDGFRDYGKPRQPELTWSDLTGGCSVAREFNRVAFTPFQFFRMF
jgi:hypothetical protein